ncbi:MAG: site-specific integrase [Methanomassiliicoccaceae archaeon]|jgi:integrase|nr:site-specific integrase [Methanomassiliicoccaceae archaeon]
MSKLPETAERCVELWIKYHEDHETLPKSIGRYQGDSLRAIRIFRFFEKQDLPYKWEEDDLIWIKKYWLSDHVKPDGKKSKPLAISTVKGYIDVISLLAAHYGNNVGKMSKIKYGQDERPNVDWLEFGDIVKLLNHPMDPLQRAAIHCMANLAMRRIECIRLKLRMINFVIRTVEVDGKGHKRRILPFHRNSDPIFMEWLEDREKLREKAMAFARKHHRKFVDCDSFFVFRRGPGIFAYSEKGNGFDKQVKDKLTKETGIKIKNHTLRRTWGRETYYRGGAKMRDISAIYGHSSEITTERYIGVDNRRVKETMEKTPY